MDIHIPDNIFLRAPLLPLSAVALAKEDLRLCGEKSYILALLIKQGYHSHTMQTEEAHSILTSKGQTTVPSCIREALRLKAGDRILYEIKGDTVVIRPHPGAMAVFGALKPTRDKAGVPFAEARLNAREKRLKDTARKASR